MNSSILCIIFFFHSRIHCVHCSQCEQAEWQRHPGQADFSIACPLNNTLNTEFKSPKVDSNTTIPEDGPQIPQSPNAITCPLLRPFSHRISTCLLLLCLLSSFGPKVLGEQMSCTLDFNHAGHCLGYPPLIPLKGFNFQRV